MPKPRDTDSTNHRINFLADLAWANHVTAVAKAIHGGNLTTYIKLAINNQLKADGHPWNPPLEQEAPPKQKTVTKTRGRPGK